VTAYDVICFRWPRMPRPSAARAATATGAAPAWWIEPPRFLDLKTLPDRVSEFRLTLTASDTVTFR